MVKNSQCQGIRPQIHAKGSESALYRVVVKVPEFNVNVIAGLCQPISRFRSDDLNTQLTLDPIQVIIEGPGGICGRQDAQPGAAMIFHRPRARPAAHNHAGDQEGQASCCRLLDLPSDQQRGRRHDQLQAVLRRPLAVEEQDILGAGANVDGKDLHGLMSMECSS